MPIEQFAEEGFLWGQDIKVQFLIQKQKEHRANKLKVAMEEAVKGAISEQLELYEQIAT